MQIIGTPVIPQRMRRVPVLNRPTFSGGHAKNILSHSQLIRVYSTFIRASKPPKLKKKKTRALSLTTQRLRAGHLTETADQGQRNEQVSTACCSSPASCLW